MELAVRNISDAQKFRHSFLSIYEKFMVPSSQQSSASLCDDFSDRERALGKENLELKTTVADTRTQYQRKTDVLSRKLWNMMQQNTNLIEEINVFRREMTALRTRLNLLDTAVQGINPKRKDEFTKIQMLLKDVEEAKMSELEKSGVIDLYRHELRRLHLLLVLMRKVVHNDNGPGVQEVISKLQEVQLPPLVGQSRIDLVSDVVINKVSQAMNDLSQKYPGTHRPGTPYGHRAQEPATTKLVPFNPVFPKPEGKAEIPPKQLQFLQSLASPSEHPARVTHERKSGHHPHAAKKSSKEEPSAIKPEDVSTALPKKPTDMVTIVEASEVPALSLSPEPPATPPDEPQESLQPFSNVLEAKTLPESANSTEGEVAATDNPPGAPKSHTSKQEPLIVSTLPEQQPEMSAPEFPTSGTPQESTVDGQASPKDNIQA